MPESPESATMIIPQGTEIAVDAHGQLSIRTPGNLVLQNSGSFATLESVHGSVRVERGVEVEAATVRCAESCYVQGSLTAWKVIARTLHLDDTAQAHIVLQETERMEVGRGARLVGNFSSEDELFHLFSRFADQVRSLPIYTSRRRRPDRDVPDPGVVRSIADHAESGGGEDASAEELDDTKVEAPERPLPEPLRFAQSLLVRELEDDELPRAARRVLQELANLIEERDVETLRSTHRSLFAKLKDAGDNVRKAEWLIQDHFEAS